MIPRYCHPLVNELWSDEWTYGAWLEIERCVLRAQREHGIVSASETEELWLWLQRVHINDEAAGEIRAIERTTKHDVAAFLEWLRYRPIGHESPPRAAYVHYGLTSSDLVDTAQGMRFKRLAPVVGGGLHELRVQVGRWMENRTPVLGYTHGQTAEPTSMGARAWHWYRLLNQSIVELKRHARGVQVAKTSGPVGTYAHNPQQVENAVADTLGLAPCGHGASQIVPRTPLAQWANAVAVFAAACNKIATDVRLLNMLGQVRWPQTLGQVGSSAMAHKNNPIVAEQIGGLSRMASGYAQMLQPLDLWLERDISHSSVERVAVPDLWHLVFRICHQTTEMLRTMELNETRIQVSLEEGAKAAWTHRVTLAAVEDGMSIEQAREYALGYDYESYDIVGDAAWFTARFRA